MSSPAATIAAPRDLRLPARGSLFRPAVLPLAARAVAMPATHVFGISGGGDPAHLYRIALLHKPPYAAMIFTPPAAGVQELRFDLATAAEAEPRQ